MSAPSASFDEDLLAAWRRSEYRVDAENGTLVLRIDEYSPGVAALMQAEAVDCAAYITADNPLSQVVSDTNNAAARQRLEACLQEYGWHWLPGLGIDPAGDHPGEHSLLVPGMTFADAIRIGRAFRQHAILTIGPDAIPRLQMIESAP